MFGIVLGTLSLVGLVGMMGMGHRHHRHHHGHHAWAGAGGCGGDAEFRGGPWGRPGGRPEGWGRGGGRRFTSSQAAWSVLRRRLALREEQEPAFEAAWADAAKAWRRYKGDIAESRDGIGEAIKAETLDRARLAAVFEWHDASGKQLREDLVSAFDRFHADLDKDQRRRLADLVATQDPFRWFGQDGEEA